MLPSPWVGAFELLSQESSQYRASPHEATDHRVESSACPVWVSTSQRVTASSRPTGQYQVCTADSTPGRLTGCKNQRATRRVGISTALRQRAEHANQVWSWDIIHDQTEAGSILTLIDEYTKQCLAIEVDRSIRAVDAIRVLGRAIEGYGQPEQIRSDNGPEFIAQAIRQWTSTSQIQSFYIQPGLPWEQADIESCTTTGRNAVPGPQCAY